MLQKEIPSNMLLNLLGVIPTCTFYSIRNCKKKYCNKLEKYQSNNNKKMEKFMHVLHLMSRGAGHSIKKDRKKTDANK